MSRARTRTRTERAALREFRRAVRLPGIHLARDSKKTWCGVLLASLPNGEWAPCWGVIGCTGCVRAWERAH